MNFLRVILATCVIFATGGFSGYFFARKQAERGTAEPENRNREEMRARMQNELQATEAQMTRIDGIFAASKLRSHAIRDTIREPMDAEVKRVQEQIRGVLNPEQAARYEELLKQRNRYRGPKTSGTNTAQSCQLTAPNTRRSRL